jgi:hypothetical protein
MSRMALLFRKEFYEILQYGKRCIRDPPRAMLRLQRGE